MPTDVDEPGTTPLRPDDAFAVLGNETRMQILQTLGEADAPLSFSDLRERVGMRDSGQFNYHLDKLLGHFVRKADDGYGLRQAGRRVIEAVLSGAVTDVPTFEPTAVDWPCPYCGATVEVTYDETSPRPVKPFCTECPGLEGFADPFENGQLASLQLSPAGIHGRDPEAMLQAAITWEHLENLATYNGVCPRCSAPIEHTISVCDTHDASTGVCPHCTRSYAAQLYSRCTNCLFDVEELFAAEIGLTNVDLLAFLTEHGLNPATDPWSPVIGTATEEIRSIDPFEARYTYTMGRDTLTLTVADDLSVTEVRRGSTAELPE